MKKQKNVSCPVCGKKFSVIGLAEKHIQQKHPKIDVSPEAGDPPVPGDTLEPTAEGADGDTKESNETNVDHSSETEPIVLQLSYSLSGGSPWVIKSDGRWRIFHHPELPETGPSGVSLERIQGLPGKTETISNVIINELENSVKQTQAIILSSSREVAQTTHTLISAVAAASAITTHICVGGTDIREDKQRLRERPHIVVGTLGRLCSLLEHRAIDSADIKLVCIESIHQFLGLKFENDFLGFCELLPKDTKLVFLSTRMRYKANRDFGKLFTHEPHYFLVEEDPTPEPCAIPQGSDLVNVNADGTEDAAAFTDVDAAHSHMFHCKVVGCESKFPTKDELRSHARSSHWQMSSNAALAGDNISGDDKGSSRTEGVMYLCGLCERYPPFKSSWAFGRHLKRTHFESSNVAVSKVGLATHPGSGDPYMDTYLVYQTEETTGSEPAEENYQT